MRPPRGGDQPGKIFNIKKGIFMRHANLPIKLYHFRLRNSGPTPQWKQHHCAFGLSYGGKAELQAGALLHTADGICCVDEMSKLPKDAQAIMLEVRFRSTPKLG
uniref:MCM C-terminal AAA(+) ATPase domain-containing protein n=1 Tax=Photinus pyralis TaxID=7054 RepID=A0A1Y1K5Q1_PHOPY